MFRLSKSPLLLISGSGVGARLLTLALFSLGFGFFALPKKNSERDFFFSMARASILSSTCGQV